MKTWTKEEFELIKKCFKENKSVTEVAKILNVTRGMLYFIRRELGLITNHKTKINENQIPLLIKYTNEGKTNKECADLLGWTINTLRYTRKTRKIPSIRKRWLPLTKQQKENCREMLKQQDKTYKEIAAILNVNPRKVENFCNMHRLYYHRNHLKYTEEDKLILFNQLNNGVPIKQISEMIKKSITSIINYLYKKEFKEKYDTLIKEAQKDLRWIRTSKSLNTFLTHKIKAAKARATRLNWEFDIDLEYILDIYNHQNGKCFYTGIQLDYEVGSDYQASIDRISSDISYIKGNICLVCWKVNAMKNDLSKEDFIKLCKIIADKHPI